MEEGKGENVSKFRDTGGRGDGKGVHIKDERKKEAEGRGETSSRCF